jgi:hypothetical protein
MIFSFTSKGLMNYFFNKGLLPSFIDTIRLEFPTIQEKQARISGACAMTNGELLLTASVEDTPDWMSDGPVLGSFICRYSPQTRQITASYLLQDKNGQPLKEKLETLELITEHPLKLLALSDNDNGTSTLFYLSIKHGNR